MNKTKKTTPITLTTKQAKDLNDALGILEVLVAGPLAPAIAAYKAATPEALDAGTFASAPRLARLFDLALRILG